MIARSRPGLGAGRRMIETIVANGEGGTWRLDHVTTSAPFVGILEDMLAGQAPDQAFNGPAVERALSSGSPRNVRGRDLIEDPATAKVAADLQRQVRGYSAGAQPVRHPPRRRPRAQINTMARTPNHLMKTG